MYIWTGRRSNRARAAGKTNRLRGKLKAKNRRRVNRMRGRRLSRRLGRAGGS